MAGSNQAASLGGMLNNIADMLGTAPQINGMNAGQAFGENIRMAAAPKLNAEDPASLEAYADWALRNGKPDEAARYRAAAATKRKELQKQQGASIIARTQAAMQNEKDPTKLAQYEQALIKQAESFGMDPTAMVGTAANVTQNQQQQESATLRLQQAKDEAEKAKKQEQGKPIIARTQQQMLQETDPERLKQYEAALIKQAEAFGMDPTSFVGSAEQTQSLQRRMAAEEVNAKEAERSRKKTQLSSTLYGLDPDSEGYAQQIEGMYKAATEAGFGEVVQDHRTDMAKYQKAVSDAEAAAAKVAPLSEAEMKKAKEFGISTELPQTTRSQLKTLELERAKQTLKTDAEKSLTYGVIKDAVPAILREISSDPLADQVNFFTDDPEDLADEALGDEVFMDDLSAKIMASGAATDLRAVRALVREALANRGGRSATAMADYENDLAAKAASGLPEFASEAEAQAALDSGAIAAGDDVVINGEVFTAG